MSASFPNARKTFSAVVNGVTKLVAALFNSPYDEISAIEDFVGPTGGGDLSFSETLTNMLLNYRRYCSVDYKSASDLYVRSGEIMLSDASGNRRLRRNTVDTTVTWANIDTGAEASSTVYYVYAVADTSATTFTVKISTSASAPSGATYYRKIGVFYNDGSSNIAEISNLGEYCGFGNWVSKAFSTVYLASTDGWVVGWAEADNGDDIYGYTDASNPPTTARQRLGTGSGTTEAVINMGFPVRKGDYWKVQAASGSEGGSAGGTTNAVFFIPAGY